MNPNSKVPALVLAGLLVLALAWAASVGAFAPSTAPANTGRSDSGSSFLACQHWHNIESDVQAGILTDAELRTKVGEVRSSATSPAVEQAATHLLAAITRRDKGDALVAYAELDTACQ